MGGFGYTRMDALKDALAHFCIISFFSKRVPLAILLLVANGCMLFSETAYIIAWHITWMILIFIVYDLFGEVLIRFLVFWKTNKPVSTTKGETSMNEKGVVAKTKLREYPVGEWVSVRDTFTGDKFITHFLVKFQGVSVIILPVRGEIEETVAVYINQEAFKYNDYTKDMVLEKLTLIDVYRGLIKNKEEGKTFINYLLNYLPILALEMSDTDLETLTEYVYYRDIGVELIEDDYKPI